MSTGRSIHAVPSITPSPREGIEYGPEIARQNALQSRWRTADQGGPARLPAQRCGPPKSPHKRATGERTLARPSRNAPPPRAGIRRRRLRRRRYRPWGRTRQSLGPPRRQASAQVPSAGFPATLSASLVSVGVSPLEQDQRQPRQWIAHADVTPHTRLRPLITEPLRIVPNCS